MTVIATDLRVPAGGFGVIAGRLLLSFAALALGDEPVRWLRAYADLAFVHALHFTRP